MSTRMDELAAQQPGYLGQESAHEEAVGITVSYWLDHDAAADWKQVAEHLIAQERGRSTWYADYTVRVATVERDYRKPAAHRDSRVIEETPRQRLRRSSVDQCPGTPAREPRGGALRGSKELDDE